MDDRLKAYRQRRDFHRTPEPDEPEPGAPGWLPALPALADGRFVIQEHHARRLHWDLRLEEDGVLRSWAVPKGVPLERGSRRLAVATEDHPLGYLDFEGEIPPGQYGAGRVLVWDRGYYRRVAARPGRLEVILIGQRVRGDYLLVHTGGDRWLLWKRFDEAGGQAED